MKQYYEQAAKKLQDMRNSPNVFWDEIINVAGGEASSRAGEKLAAKLGLSSLGGPLGDAIYTYVLTYIETHSVRESLAKAIAAFGIDLIVDAFAIAAVILGGPVTVIIISAFAISYLLQKLYDYLYGRYNRKKG